MLDLEGQLHERVEEVAIENVHVGDYLILPSADRPALERCVLSKVAMRFARTTRVAGWHLDLTDGGTVWLPRRTKVKRRRFGASRVL